METKLKDDPGITMLVNNSGFASVVPLLDADIQKMEDMIALNVTALTRLRVRNASLSASSAEILADIPLGWLRTIAGTLAQSVAGF